MIRFRPRGGLGNQLFCYAVAKSIANKLNTRLEADLLYLVRDQQRRFELDSFNSKITSVRSPNRRFPLRIGRMLPVGRVFFERSPRFDAKVLTVGNGVTIDGYFQSWRYFEGIERELANELREISSPSYTFQSLLAKVLEQPNSTFLHIRRGDYEKSGFGLVSGGFYDKAIKLIEAVDGPQEIFVLSDDPLGANKVLPKSLRERCTTLPGSDSIRPIEILNLMASTRHSVIANSTFSWWGAWLSQPDAGLVIFPRPWIDKVQDNDRDMHPPGWIGLHRHPQ